LDAGDLAILVQLTSWPEIFCVYFLRCAFGPARPGALHQKKVHPIRQVGEAGRTASSS